MEQNKTIISMCLLQCNALLHMRKVVEFCYCVKHMKKKITTSQDEWDLIF